MWRLPGLVSFAGEAFRSVPADEPFELDSLVSRDGENDRWNRPGEPTIYLALDAGVALAETGRHLSGSAGTAGCQRLVRLWVRTDGLVDLRDAATRRSLGIEGGPAAFLDRRRTHELSARFRAAPGCRGLLAPSMGLVDQPDRGNLVVFADRLDGGPASLVDRWDEVGRVEVVSG
jgi:RES domain-containing protein